MVGRLLARLPVPDLGRQRAGLETAFRARIGGASLVVSHDPRVTLACAFYLRCVGYSGPHLAFSFNFPMIPDGLQLRLMRAAYQRVDRFVVFSTVERELYRQAFDLSSDRLTFIHWGVNPPKPEPSNRPVISGTYACAIGGNGRDYATLVAAMRTVPHIRLVLVARPENLRDLEIPRNIEVRTNIPLGEAMNILAFSQFMVLPLAGGTVPCGHVTVVNAMHLGKAVIATESTGLTDYLHDGQTGLACLPGSAEALAGSINRLWEDVSLRERLGRGGQAFAASHCTEQHTVNWFQEYLRGLKILDR